jgi:hypothetical protein
MAAPSLARAAEGAPPRVAVVEVKKVALPGALSSDALRTAAANGARAEGAEVVDVRAADAVACADVGCWARVAKDSGATHVLVLDGSYGRFAYRLSVSAWSAKDQERRSQTDAECDACAAKDMVAKAEELSRRVLAAERARASERPDPAGGTPAVRAAFPATPPASGQVEAVASPPVGPAEPSGPGRGLTYGLLGGGAAALIAGGVLWSRDGDGRSCDVEPATGRKVCPEVLDTKPVAIPLVGVGVGAVGWGLWRLFQRSEPSQVAVMVGPRTLLLRGRF